MRSESADSRYWYARSEDDAARHRAVDLLQAFRMYRAAELAMRRRTRQSMNMGENDLLVLRFLLRAQREGRHVSPTEITRYLGVSTASTASWRRVRHEITTALSSGVMPSTAASMRACMSPSVARTSSSEAAVAVM